jgi:hypothetical protein
MTKHQPNRSLSRRPKKLVPATAADRLLGSVVSGEDTWGYS